MDILIKNLDIYRDLRLTRRCNGQTPCYIILALDDNFEINKKQVSLLQSLHINAVVLYKLEDAIGFHPSLPPQQIMISSSTPVPPLPNLNRAQLKLGPAIAKQLQVDSTLSAAILHSSFIWYYFVSIFSQLGFILTLRSEGSSECIEAVSANLGPEGYAYITHLRQYLNQSFRSNTLPLGWKEFLLPQGMFYSILTKSYLVLINYL